MRRKISSEVGLTMIEMLAATMILMLLALMLNTGLQMAFNTYQTMIAKSELDLLLSTAVDALADDLRYARDVDGENDSGFHYYIAVDETTGEKTGKNEPLAAGTFGYISDSFGVVTELKVDDKGQLTVKNDASSDLRVLSTGVYGNDGISYKAYEVTEMTVTYNKPTSTFTIKLTVATTDGKISVETPGDGVTVRCLNPPYKDTTT